jgi:CBS domain-containing protein
VTKLVDDVLPMHRHTSFPVAVDGKLHGILTLAKLKMLPREQWSKTAVKSVMLPVGPNFFVRSSTTIESATSLMKQNGIGSVAVVDDEGLLVGYLHSGRIKRVKCDSKPSSR